MLTLKEDNTIIKTAHYWEEDKLYCYNEILNIDDIFYVTTESKTHLMLTLLKNGSLVKVGEYEDTSASSLMKMVQKDNHLFIRAGNGIVVLDINNC